jgi:hypothetical protein
MYSYLIMFLKSFIFQMYCFSSLLIFHIIFILQVILKSISINHLTVALTILQLHSYSFYFTYL